MSPPGRMEAKTTSKGKSQSSGSHQTAATPQEAALKCPRCDSSDTKFCYYNNYSLTQPRYYCKTCRRYWTKGGTMRNLPVGAGHVRGGWWKNKKNKSSLRVSQHYSTGSSNRGKLNLPATASISPFGLYQMHLALQKCVLTAMENLQQSLVLIFTPSGNSPLMGFNFHFPSVFKHGAGTPGLSHGVQKRGSFLNPHCDLATSFESLISINQDIHLKLQQQRLITMEIFNQDYTHRVFDKFSQGKKIWGSSAAESNVSSTNLEHQIQKPKSISFQNLYSPK
ncbi:unnamed protein product [Fraxinus pennsylvanica]|uniref:Dof zinc finger protein n=1 Tax=Fraxinus pennsylvanica TaxID=56036 RepID=A0AAD1Z678_9LAMI|nr:unnamed protein product [Fraxinus pennsylvanica]